MCYGKCSKSVRICICNINFFVIALSASIYLLSEVKTTSRYSFSRIDTKQFYQDAELRDEELTSEGNIKYNGRIVNIENNNSITL